MKILFKIPFLLLVISLTQASDKADNRYEKYYKNYCEGNFKNLSKLGAFLTCTGDDATPTLEGEKEISGILKNLEVQNLQELCDNPESFKGFDEIILGDDSKNIFSLPANECSCSIRSNKIKKDFCSLDFKESLRLPEIEDHLNLLRKIDSIENYDENLSRCASTIFPNGELKNIQSQIKEIESLIEFNQTSNSKLTAILELLKFAPADEPKSSDSSECTAIQENNVTEKVLDITFKDGTSEIDHKRRNAVYECLAEDTKQVVIKNEIKRSQIIDPDLAIDPDDSETIKQAKYAIQERRNNYKEAVEKTTILSSELNDLTDRLQNVKSEKDLNAIYKRISEIKSELKSFGKYGYSYKDHLTKFKDLNKKISSIAKDRGYKIEEYEESNSNIASSPKNNQKGYSDDQVLKKFPGTAKNSNSHVVSESTNKPYVPVYAAKKEVKRTNIAPPSRAETEKIRNEEKSAKAQAVKNNISSTFASTPSSQSTRSSSSGRSPASISGGSTNIKTYEIQNLNKEPEVLNDKSFPNIKVVFIDDIKIMKLFKLENSTYKLKEEISKEEFIENFDQFPAMVKEQGRDFFRVFDAKNLSN